MTIRPPTRRYWLTTIALLAATFAGMEVAARLFIAVPAEMRFDPRDAIAGGPSRVHLLPVLNTRLSRDIS